VIIEYFNCFFNYVTLLPHPVNGDCILFVLECPPSAGAE